MRKLSTVILTSLMTWSVAHAEKTTATAQKAILVTGASTGIGRKVTERLAADGYFVYAGARKEEDLKALGAIKNVQAVHLDVTKPEDIDAAVATIQKGGRGLYGLVNNAGVATLAPFADMKMDEFDLVMAVNVYGPVRVTRAFLPLILAQKGRIINIGSISGILASPNLTAYAMSKHAVEAFTDSLAQQLHALGVQVTVIEPGNYNSDIAKNAVQRAGGEMPFPTRRYLAGGRPVQVQGAGRGGRGSRAGAFRPAAQAPLHGGARTSRRLKSRSRSKSSSWFSSTRGSPTRTTARR